VSLGSEPSPDGSGRALHRSLMEYAPRHLTDKGGLVCQTSVNVVHYKLLAGRSRSSVTRKLN
jgi:hypothetical protein